MALPLLPPNSSFPLDRILPPYMLSFQSFLLQMCLYASIGFKNYYTCTQYFKTRFYIGKVWGYSFGSKV